MKLKAAATPTLSGTAVKSNLEKRVFLSSSSPQEPRIRDPPEEKGLIAEDCAPRTMQANSAVADGPVEATSPGNFQED